MTPIPKSSLLPSVQALLRPGEQVVYAAQPIRHPNGIGVWMIMCLGPIFIAAASGAVGQSLSSYLASNRGLKMTLGLLVMSAGALLLLTMGVLWLFWPILSRDKMRRTHALVTDQRVLHIVLPTHPKRSPKVRQWAVMACDQADVVRRRGESATLVLTEGIRERKADGKFLYIWDALHGLPRADEALSALQWARAQEHAQIGAAVSGA